MSKYTYEFEDRQECLERYEWDNVWWEQANRQDSPKRVLYIGDSISCGTRKIATAISGELLFDGFGTSKALDNPYLTGSISNFAKQQGDRCAVILNNGLHGWHLDDIEQYPVLYETLVQFLLTEFKDTPIALILTTSVANEDREKRVKLRNQAVVQIAEKYDLPVIDLYSVSVEYSAYRREDGVHFAPEGYQKFAERIVDDLNRILNK